MSLRGRRGRIRVYITNLKDDLESVSIIPRFQRAWDGVLCQDGKVVVGLYKKPHRGTHRWFAWYRDVDGYVEGFEIRTDLAEDYWQCAMEYEAGWHVARAKD